MKKLIATDVKTLPVNIMQYNDACKDDPVAAESCMCQEISSCGSGCWNAHFTSAHCEREEMISKYVIKSSQASSAIRG